MRPLGEMRRESQNSSIPVPRFQSGSGLLTHTCGTSSHSGMIDYPTDIGIASGDGRTKKKTQGQTCDGSLAPCEAERRQCLRNRSPRLPAVLSPRPSLKRMVLFCLCLWRSAMSDSDDGVGRRRRERRLRQWLRHERLSVQMALAKF